MILQSAITVPDNFWSVQITDIISVLLTLVLVGVYIKMYSVQDQQKGIQDKQSEIMEQQTSIMSANHKPDIYCDDYEVEGDSFIALLKNAGNGPADNLQIQCAIHKQTQSEDGEFRFAPGFAGEGTVIATKFSRLARRRTHPRNGNRYPNGEGRNGFLDEQESAWFEGAIKLQPQHLAHENYDTSFRGAMERVSESWEVNQVGFDISIVWTDIIGQSYTEVVASRKSVPNREMDLEEAFEEGDPSNPIMGFLPEEQGDPMLILDPEKFQPNLMS